MIYDHQMTWPFVVQGLNHPGATALQQLLLWLICSMPPSAALQIKVYRLITAPLGATVSHSHNGTSARTKWRSWSGECSLNRHNEPTFGSAREPLIASEGFFAHSWEGFR